MTLSHDNTLNNPNNNNKTKIDILTLNGDLTTNECLRCTFEGGDRSGGSKLTLLDPKSNIISIQFSNSNHKVLTESKQSK